MDNDRFLKTLSEILAVASEISAIKLRNQEIVKNFIAFEAQRDREHDALIAVIQRLETRLRVNNPV
jgi:predicted metal-dependent hydrolase